jgi:hypothetical protein
MKRIFNFEVNFYHLLKIFFVSLIISLSTLIVLLILIFAASYFIQVRFNSYDLSIAFLIVTFLLLVFIIIFFNKKIKASNEKVKSNSYKVIWILLLIIYLIISIFPVRYIIQNPPINIKQINDKEIDLALLKDSIVICRNNDTIPLNETGKLNSGNSNSWQLLESKSGRFKVEFPNLKIKASRKTLLIGEKEKIFCCYRATVNGAKDYNLGYSVDYSFWPDIKTNLDAKDLFKKQRNYIVSSSNAKLEYEKILDSPDCFGCEMYFSIHSANCKLTYRMFFKNGILFRIFVITGDDRICNESIYHFLDSFKIL